MMKITILGILEKWPDRKPKEEVGSWELYGCETVATFSSASYARPGSAYMPACDEPKHVFLLMLLDCFLKSFKAKTYNSQDFLKTQKSLYKLGRILIRPLPDSLFLLKNCTSWF